ncbi:MAG: glycosyltransferase, partial [Treponema sp.]|nr:glycosyltransferase [Treponema sp.]
PELRVISNGMLPDSVGECGCAVPREERKDGFYTIVTTGRCSVEKDQQTLLKAMRYSKFADRIRLVIAGHGPIENQLKKEADALVREGVLKTPPEFCFCNADELKKIYSGASLYVHCATVEVEGMSCMEAIQTGLVPIIAKAKLSATSQFALSEESLFKGGNAKDLAAKIDWWLSDDERRKKEAVRYLGVGKEYDIRKSIESLRKMFRDSVEK